MDYTYGTVMIIFSLYPPVYNIFVGAARVPVGHHAALRRWLVALLPPMRSTLRYIRTGLFTSASRGIMQTLHAMYLKPGFHVGLLGHHAGAARDVSEV
jgi:hypothetical protein